LAKRASLRSPRILDVGCGNGDLIAYLAHTLPGVGELQGYDVADSGHVVTGFPATTIARLGGSHPDVDWTRRIEVGQVGAPWPHEDDTFDVVCSNQVLEHVFDLAQFFSELRRVMRPGGFGVHVFPFRRVLWEAHTATPLSHRFRDRDVRAVAVRAWSKLGFGRFKQYSHRMDFDDYVELSTDLIQFACFHRNWPELADAARVAGLSASRRYTSGYYVQKLRAVRGMAPLETYRALPGVAEALASEALTLIASGTLILEKPTNYAPWTEPDCG
jgi:SAM-dependent methyltransferase